MVATEIEQFPCYTAALYVYLTYRAAGAAFICTFKNSHQMQHISMKKFSRLHGIPETENQPKTKMGQKNSHICKRVVIIIERENTL